jgi:uncharacterized protein YihD (DUF1040 family)
MPKTQRSIIYSIIVAILLFSQNVFADRSSNVRELFSVMGTGDAISGIAVLQADLTLEDLRQKYSMSSEFEKAFKEVFVEVLIFDLWAPGGFVDMMIPAFDDLSDADITKLISFYKTPVGQKIVKISANLEPTIRSLMPAWQKRISQNLMPQMQNKLKTRGFEMPRPK